jgi:carbamoyl-phosphate synthase small subunit
MALLVLEDGREFKGKSFGAQNLGFGELVFNTGMTGYQEIITDPSYAGQIITFTYPEIGNYGTNPWDNESNSVHTKGVVVKNYNPEFSNFRAKQSLGDFLESLGICGIYDLDTRAITKHIRDKGAMKAVIAPDSIKTTKEELLSALATLPSMQGQDLASIVTAKEIHPGSYKSPTGLFTGNLKTAKYKVITFDFGIKQNIINKLIEHGCDVTLVPANTSADYVLEQDPDGVFLSNGPGDPSAVNYAIQTIETLIQKFKKPIFGICLGHQLLALANQAKTYKLKFGHRGSNQPVKNLETGKIEIASHNHGFAVSKENLPDNISITHLNINDDTIAGIRLKNRPEVFSVQYHPESSPGPHDSDYLFEEFTKLLEFFRNP